MVFDRGGGAPVPPGWKKQIERALQQYPNLAAVPDNGKDEPKPTPPGKPGVSRSKAEDGTNAEVERGISSSAFPCCGGVRGARMTMIGAAWDR